MYKIGSMPHSIPIGYTGETNFRSIEIDMTAWMDKMPDGVPSIVHIRPGEEKEDAYVAVTEFDRETGILSWTITAADIGTLEGEGEMQVWLEETENDTVNKRGKSVIVTTKVIEAANDPDENVPTSQEAFLEQVTSLKTQTVTAKEAAEDAQAAAEDAQEAAEQAAEDAENVNLHPAYIDETTKNWMVYDAENHEYVDTEIKAQGEDGQDGQDGQDATPTLVCPAYADLTFPVSAGTLCYKDGTLYKAKQDISTSEAWTAAHWDATNLATEQRLLLSDLQGISDDVSEVEEYLSESIGSDNTTAITKTVPVGASYAFVMNTGTKSIVYNQQIPLFSKTHNNIEYSTDSNGWTTAYGESSGNTAFNICDTYAIPLGHIGAVLIDLDGIELQTSLSNGFQAYIGAGRGYNEGTVKEVMTGSRIYQSDSYTWSVFFRCGPGKSVDGKIRVQLFDLTQMFGSGNEPATLNDFLAIFTGSYYPYNTEGTQITISCDKILLNNVEQTVSPFAVSSGDTITIHTSTSIDNIVMPVASTITYTGINFDKKEEVMVYQEESEKVTTDLLNENADLRIMLFTDNHDYTPFKYEKYADMMSRGIVDYLVGLGDYKDYSTSHDKIWYKTNLLNALTKAGREANCLYAVGNHDVGIKGVQGAPNSADYLLNPMECFDVLNRNYSKNPAIVYDEDNPFGGWYYLDDEKSKIRMIILQSSDIFKSDGSFVRYKDELMFMSQGQLTWFCEKACKLNKADTTGWGIIVFIHNDKPYGSTNNALFKVLKAVKNGTSITETFTVYNRMTLDGNTWTTTRDEVNGDTLEIDSDYTSQGAIDVLGVIHGHGHADDVSTIETINDIQVRCDNGTLDDYYLASVNGITAGTYWFTDVDGKKWAITYSNSYNDVAYIGYNYYFAHASVSPMPISRYDSDGNRIRSNGGCEIVQAAPSGATEVTGFVRERGNTRIGQESAEILCIDRENRTLTFIPYGTATKHIVSF